MSWFLTDAVHIDRVALTPFHPLVDSTPRRLHWHSEETRGELRKIEGRVGQAVMKWNGMAARRLTNTAEGRKGRCTAK